MKIVVPMAGSDERFRNHGFPFAKPVIEIDGRPMIEHATDCLNVIDGVEFVFIVRKEDDLRFHLREVLQLLHSNCHIVRTEGDTAGAACTALLAVEHVANDDELLIANADQILAFDVAAAISDFRKRKLDAGTVVFDSVHPRWSFVKTDENGMVIEAAEKRPISRNATAGVYYFRRGQDFVDAAQTMIMKGADVNGGYFVCPTFNELILLQKSVGTYQVDRAQYISLATPQAVEDYEQELIARRREAAS
ncbi:glycosyltransferase family 2 protein (plasmid) [Ruegeria sp. SCSIO 43209]|uniref:glycosyltransferase family 2 protein n=1 Tax=Ruegeria sp. SCSIO 43209 TaxID=2793010 RepID=UPI00147B5341|nr:glycosyltransferase family 2 protein [Ruegeria sp. SCSIO 43209]UAB91727.1 glycosyltransferase family 2 protein [Ruegeria sp. SCSIO 43209]